MGWGNWKRTTGKKIEFKLIKYFELEVLLNYSAQRYIIGLNTTELYYKN